MSFRFEALGWLWRACLVAAGFVAACPAIASGEAALERAPSDRWLVIWGGGKERSDAERAKHLLEAFDPILRARGLVPPRNFPAILDSSEHAGLNPGFHIVAVGLCGRDEAKAYCDRLRRLYRGVYVRRLTGSKLTSGCPSKGEATEGDRTGKPSDRDSVARLARAVYAQLVDQPRLQLLFGEELKCLAAWGMDCASAQRQHASALAGEPPGACRSLSGMADTKVVLKVGAASDDAWSVAVCADQEKAILAALARRPGERWRLVDLFARARDSVGRIVGSVSLDAVAAKGRVVCLERGLVTGQTMYGHTSHLSRLYCYWDSTHEPVMNGLPNSPVVFKLSVWLENEYDDKPDWQVPDEIIGDDGVVDKSESMKVRYWLRDVGPAGLVLCLAEQLEENKVSIQADITAFGIKDGRMRRVKEDWCKREGAGGLPP